MTIAMQNLLEQECPDYFSAENIDRMKEEEERNEAHRCDK